MTTADLLVLNLDDRQGVDCDSFNRFAKKLFLTHDGLNLAPLLETIPDSERTHVWSKKTSAQMNLEFQLKGF